MNCSNADGSHKVPLSLIGRSKEPRCFKNVQHFPVIYRNQRCLWMDSGWALVFAVEDVNTGKEYALKKLVAVDEETNKTILQEIEILRSLSGHPNIIQFLCVHRVECEDPKSYEYFLVTEYCPGGTIADILRNLSTNTLTVAQVCRIAYQATRAVHHMHSQKPLPIIHRDIKLENYLIGSDGLVKLCDFGSVTTHQLFPDSSWNAQKRATLEDQMAKFTTPMYRAPEITDTWNNEPIGPSVDCWALGCILYALVTLRHPFPEGNKLAVLNAKYAPLPPNPRFACFHDVIKGCLQISPIQRHTTATVLERLAAIAESNNFDPREPSKIQFVIKPRSPTRLPAVTLIATGSPSRASPALTSSSRPVPISQPPGPKAPIIQSTGLFTSLKGGAGNILRNLKDTSSKVMHTMQHSIARTELDVSYLTSRIMVMPYPADGIESAYRANHIEDVRAFLQARHPPPTKIQLYNLSRGRCNVHRLPGRHIDCSFAFACVDSNALLFSAVYQICQDIYRYLHADLNHVIVLYCADGLRACATVACALLLYSRTFVSSEEAIALFTARRCHPQQLQPSELQIINYMAFLSNSKLPHTEPLVLRSILIQPVPLFTRAKDGCRPYIEIYSNGSLVISTKRPEYEEMRLFNMIEGKICLLLGGVTVRGDITVVIFHARQQLGRIIGIKVAAMHFHTGYASLTEGCLTFENQDLDDIPEIRGQFRVVLNITIGDESGKTTKVPSPWEVKIPSDLIPDPLFGSCSEMEKTLKNFRSTYQREQASDETPLIAESGPLEGKSFLKEVTPHEEEVTEDKQKEKKIKSAEADLLNLGLSELPTYLIPDTSNVSIVPVNPGLDIFSNSYQNKIDLLPDLGDIHQHTSNAQPKINELLSNDLLLGLTQSPRNGSSPRDMDINDLIFGQSQVVTVQSQNTDISFDPLGSSGKNDLFGEGAPLNENTLRSNDESCHRNLSTPNFTVKSNDPFENLSGYLGAGLTNSYNSNPQEANTFQCTNSATSGIPVHSSSRTHRSIASSDTMSVTESTDSKPVKSGDAFEDLLGSQGYNFFSTRKSEKECPKTINQMRKVEAARTMDPDRLKILEWTEGKKSNLRALLCSMHTIIWKDCRWQRCEMHQLVSPADVKKAYRRACLAVHPDKQTGTSNENIAKLIFVELNNSWSVFENDASQQNLFS